MLSKSLINSFWESAVPRDITAPIPLSSTGGRGAAWPPGAAFLCKGWTCPSNCAQRPREEGVTQAHWAFFSSGPGRFKPKSRLEGAWDVQLPPTLQHSEWTWLVLWDQWNLVPGFSAKVFRCSPKAYSSVLSVKESLPQVGEHWCWQELC